MKKHILIFFLLSKLALSPVFLFSQDCGLMVDAGTDFQICEPETMINLNGNVASNASFTLWSPASSISDPTILNPQASVLGTTTFFLSGYVPGSINLIENGDFENGNTGFSSDYNYAPPGVDLISGGTYTVASSPDIVSSILPPCVDHTTGDGQMMIVNGDGNTGANVWCQTVNLNPVLLDRHLQLFALGFLIRKPGFLQIIPLLSFV